jgi:2-oxo-4-hydroxy-4-carboxy-5-ureidoimidazoline decarboxylase
MDLQTFNTLDGDARKAVFLGFCGAHAWADAMVAAGPFADLEALHAAAGRAFDGLNANDWQAAFAHHPRIGDRAALEQRFGTSGRHSDREQAAVATATEDVLDALLRLNDAYFDRHGHIFIVFATGKTASQMLALLEARIGRTLDEENATCAEEQRKITALRIDRHFGRQATTT